MLNFSICYKSCFVIRKYKIKKLLQQCIRVVNDEFKITKKLFFDVVIISNHKMKTINFKYRQNNHSTDVLTFALHDSKKSIKTDLLGEIFLSPRFIKKNRIKSFNYDFVNSFVHGILHLLGYDHNDKDSYNKMLLVQKKIMGKIIL